MFSRRQFVAGAGSLATASIIAPQALANGLSKKALFRGGKFTDGIASGDPTTDAITLWSRLHEVSGAGSARLEVATDADFKKVVATKKIGTSGASGHSLKARVKGLKPHERYFYRFETEGEHSEVGRFQTALPADSNEKVRFAYFSCQLYPHGFWNAHALMAKDDLDFVVCLGDYIYSEVYFDKSPGAVRKDTVGIAESVDEYRRKYSLYHSDEDLRKVKRMYPMISTWDDHEVKDNYTNDPKDESYQKKRIAAGYQTFFENIPTFAVNGKTRIYRSFQFGKNVELVVADERQYRENQPCNDAVAPPCPELGNPRDFLGRKQMEFVQNRLKKTPALWKLIANEVLIMPVKLSDTIQAKYDAWNGYPGEREELLSFIKSNNIENVAFLTGDLHTFIAGDVRNAAGETLASEFVGGSVSSIRFAELDLATQSTKNVNNPVTDPSFISLLKGVNTNVYEADFDHHGYALVEASSKSLDVKFRRLKTTTTHSLATLPDMAYTLKPGQRGLLPS